MIESIVTHWYSVDDVLPGKNQDHVGCLVHFVFYENGVAYYKILEAEYNYHKGYWLFPLEKDEFVDVNNKKSENYSTCNKAIITHWMAWHDFDPEGKFEEEPARK